MKIVVDIRAYLAVGVTGVARLTGAVDCVVGHDGGVGSGAVRNAVGGGI